MKVYIHPSRAVGSVSAPPSKSMAHRLLICAGLSAGKSTVRHLAMSEDVIATIACLRALGAEIEIDGDTATVYGVDVRENMTGESILPCNECGSTLRFFLPLCLLSGAPRTLTGTAYLMSRPLSVYEDICREQGLTMTRTPSSVEVCGTLRAGVYEFPGNISSQFVSGLLFALPLLSGDSEIRLLPPIESRPYIEMTLAALRTFGIEISQRDNTYYIKGSQRYTPADITVEGDCSNAAFFEAFNYIGGEVAVTGLNPDTIQGDRVYRELFERIKNGGDTIDIADCPDLGPILFAVAAVYGGAKFSGTKRLRIKESDRAHAMQEELRKFGVDVIVGENTVTVAPGILHRPQEVLCGHGDHRIVMGLSVLSTIVGAEIDGAQSVRKSFPDFFDRLRDLQIEVDEYGMD